jgi:oligopeptide/dipeptide ABC transporter ATP-binding protein
VAPLLEVEGLSIELQLGGRWVPVVRRLDLAVERGEFVGLAGESGSGKSLTALALLRLVPPPLRIAAGRVLLDGRDLLALDERELRRVRGARVAMVFQEPASALDPVFTVGWQIAEVVRLRRRVSRREARAEARRLLDLVAVADAGRRLDQYPHELSGGQRQRVMIALALAGEPDLLLADEPTTALDVTLQAQILDLLDRLRRDLGMAVLLITHDLAVVAGTCERLVVMYAGEVVEEGPVAQIFGAPAHPYTRALLAALPRLGRPALRGGLPAIPGRVPPPEALPEGCAFHPRCPEVFDPCRASPPALYALPGARRARCFLHGPPPVPAPRAGGAP